MLLACTALLLVSMILGVAIGSVPISPQAVLRVIADHLAGHPRYSVADAIVWEIRLPRVLLAALVGATLATAGTVVQVLVRNALADPFLLGVSSGASVGATAVLLFGAFASLGAWAISAGSVLGALGAMGAVFLVSRQGRALSPTQLILCGVVLSALFESVTSFLIFRGNPQATQAVLFWLLGSFGLATWPQLPIPAIVLAAAMAYLLAQGRSLNALALGAGSAAALGVDLHRLRREPVHRDLADGRGRGRGQRRDRVRRPGGPAHRPPDGRFGTPPGPADRDAVRRVLHGARRPARPGDRRAAGNADRRDHRVHRRTAADRAHPAPALPVRGDRMSLELRDLCVDIAGRRIVTGIGLTVPDGTFAGLLGPNGSGKSTILKAIYRVHRPAAGRVLMDGQDLLALRPRDAARRIAVVAQEFTLEFDFTVAELVMIGRTPHKRAFDRDDDTDRAIAEQAIERVGCQHLAHRGFNTLSGGEKQRVLIAQALAQGADHLILDEPTSHLDIRYQVEILELVAGLGITVLAAIHDISLAALFCDTVHLIADGQLITGGPPEQVLTAATVRAAYGTEVLVIAHPETGTPHLIPRRARHQDRPAPQASPAPDPPDATGH